MTGALNLITFPIAFPTQSVAFVANECYARHDDSTVYVVSSNIVYGAKAAVYVAGRVISNGGSVISAGFGIGWIAVGY